MNEQKRAKALVLADHLKRAESAKAQLAAAELERLHAAIVEARDTFVFAAFTGVFGKDPTPRDCELMIEISKPESAIGKLTAIINGE